MSLRSLSDTAILSRIHKLARCEREVTLRVLQHLNEIERRKLHLKLGYASMFVYCTKGLGYSESAAVRRIRSARCAVRHPEVYSLLKRNDVNLTTLSLVLRVLRPANKDRLFAQIRGCSQAEVKMIVAEYEPRPLPRDVVEPIVTQKVVPAVVNTLPLAGAASVAPPVGGGPSGGACENIAYRRCGGAADSPVLPASPGEKGGGIVVERRTKLSFAASEAFMGKFGRIKSLAWHRTGPNPSLEQIFELAMDAFLEQKDPRARKARREQRRELASVKGRRQSAVGNERRIAAAARDDVYTRDHGRCTFVGSNGRTCGSTEGLQVDHIVPVARGGRGTLSNLRLLCAYHNRLEADRLLGAGTTSRVAGVTTPSRAPSRHPSRRVSCPGSDVLPGGSSPP